MSGKSSTFAAFFDINYKIYRLMKKIFTFVSAAMLALGMQATAGETIQIDGINYQLNDENHTAIVLPAQAPETRYDIENIVIPASVSKDEVEYKVVELAKAAFKQTTAKSITFAEGCEISAIGMQCFQRATNITELELPEGILLIPVTAIHSDQDPATDPMALKKLVLPASVDSLAMMSVVASNLATIEFKGAVPPGCCHKFISATNYYQVPWQINAAKNEIGLLTKPECLIIVPDGSLEAYQAAPGIGDYFTTIIEKKDAPTAIENTNANTFKSGVYTITGSYLGEDATNLPKGMYIINGKKVIR